jgi:hypothetical protein
MLTPRMANREESDFEKYKNYALKSVGQTGFIASFWQTVNYNSTQS